MSTAADAEKEERGPGKIDVPGLHVLGEVVKHEVEFFCYVERDSSGALHPSPPNAEKPQDESCGPCELACCED